MSNKFIEPCLKTASPIISSAIAAKIRKTQEAQTTSISPNS